MPPAVLPSHRNDERTAGEQVNETGLRHVPGYNLMMNEASSEENRLLLITEWTQRPLNSHSRRI